MNSGRHLVLANLKLSNSVSNIILPTSGQFAIKEALMNKLMDEPSKTFCIYPWIHQMTTPAGKVNFCCISNRTAVTNENNEYYKLGKDTFKQAWNSQYMRDIRKKMLAGQEVKGCETCYEQEKFGKKSFRQSHTEEWVGRLGADEVRKIVDASISENMVVSSPPVYLDLRLGNLCNLKCRMCNPFNSIQIQKEWTSLDQEGPEYSTVMNKYDMVNGQIDAWYESDIFWNDVESYIPTLKKVYMTGGEPTLIEANYKFLDKCKESGYANKIELFFNLNFTTMKDRFIQQLAFFKWTSINASIDGFGTMNDYIRGNSRWDICSNNIEKLVFEGANNIGVGFSPVIQVYNILHLNELLQYIENLIIRSNRDILVDFLHCFNPTFLDFTILPKTIKIEAKNRLLKWAETSKTLNRDSQNSFFLRNSIDSFVTRINQTLEFEDREKIHDFINYTKILDAKRNQSFATAIPELARMLNESGYEI